MHIKKFNHIYGQNGQFIRLENRSYWLQINDMNWNEQPRLNTQFIMQQEPFFALEHNQVPIELPDNVKIFSEEAQALEQKRLALLALDELAKNLKAAKAEYDLEKLIDKVDFYLKQEDKL